MINRFGQEVKPDHPKLLNIIKYLLSIGAKPEQKCVLTSYNVFNLEEVEIIKEAEIEQFEKLENTADKKNRAVEIEWNCKVLAKSYLANKKNKTLIGTNGLAALKSLADSDLTPLSSSGFFAENSVVNGQVKTKENIQSLLGPW